jgi:AAHS family 4-hydroxybenzoate transporter-like MFS transporter
MLANQIALDRLFVFAGILALVAAGGVALAGFWGRGTDVRGANTEWRKMQ